MLASQPQNPRVRARLSNTARGDLRRGLALAAFALVCAGLGGGAVVANQGRLGSWSGQRSTHSMSVEAALMTLFDAQADEGRIASAQTVLRAAFSDGLPRLVLLRGRGGELGAAASAVLATLDEFDPNYVPSFLRTAAARLDFDEARLLLERDYGSRAARELALARLGEVFADAMHGLTRIRNRGGESGEMAEIHLAWFHSFLRLPVPRVRAGHGSGSR